MDDARAPRVLVCDASRLGCDAEVLDALASVQLVLGRLGWVLRVRDAPAALRGLVDLAGLADVVRFDD